MDYPIEHPHDAIRKGFECDLCDNPIPYLMEEIVVPIRLIIHPNDLLPQLLCDDCWETAYEAADPATVTIQGHVCTILAPA